MHTLGTLDLDFQPLELREIHFYCLSHPICGIFSWKPWPTNTLSYKLNYCLIDLYFYIVNTLKGIVFHLSIHET